MAGPGTGDVAGREGTHILDDTDILGGVDAQVGEADGGGQAAGGVPVGDRHWHRPRYDGEPYTRLGVQWHRPTCECGRVLSERRVR